MSPPPSSRSTPGLDRAGARTMLQAPPWRASYGYWRTFELARQLTAHGFSLQELQARDPAQRQFRWTPGAAPGSVAERRLVLGVSMRVAQLAMRGLCDAQLLTLAPDALGAVRFFDGARAAGDWAAAASSPWADIYVDLTAGARTAAMLVHDVPWALAGALVSFEADGVSVTPFGAPGADAPGPGCEPLARVRFLRGAGAASMEPGDVLVRGAQAPAALVCEHHDSALNARLSAALTLAGGALGVLAHCLRDDVELVSELRNPKARGRAQDGGVRVALTPVPRRA